MDRKEIARQASQMKSKEEFINLLNLIKKAEVEELGLDMSQFHPFTEKQLNYYCNPRHSYHRYRVFKIKKKSGGFRQITAPRTQTFMMMLSAVNEILRSLYTPSDYAMGFADGRSVVSNASVHKGQNYVFNIDLKDFFPSVEQPRIWKRLQLAPLNFSIPIANLIAGLCSMKETHTNEDGTLKNKYVLPQGAPTSPIITNMICDKLDRRLAGLARRFGLHYTRYADDITFSSMHNVYQANGAFRTELARIITDQGFTMNEKKTRLLKKGSRQEVTGIIVSDKLNVTRKYVRDIRNILYLWSRYGYSAAFSKFFPKYKEEKGHVKKGNPDMINVLDGKLMYLKMVKGSEDSVYQKLYMKFCVLANKDPQKHTKESKSVSYIQTSDITDFEKQNSTKIEIVKNKEGKRYGYFMLGNRKQLISINKEVNLDDKQIHFKLAISSCRGKDNKTFWLLHNKDKVKESVLSSNSVDIDKLNSELDSLLNM